MTMAVPQPVDTNAPVQWEGDTGLEDFTAADASIPRLVIDHDEAVFKDSQTEESFSSLNVMMLGLVKQRLMWSPELPDNDGKAQAPLCKSPDFRVGFPNLDPDLGKNERFPWAASNFTEANLFVPDGTSVKALPCADCRFKEWGTDPKADRPWCSEEWTIPLMYYTDAGWNPALWSVKRSGLRSAKRYFSPFSSRKTPLFTVVTLISLEQAKKGKVKYCTPTFQKMHDSDPAEWQNLAAEFKDLRAYLTAYPQPKTDDQGNEIKPYSEDIVKGEVIEAETEPAPPAAAPPTPPAPAAPSAPAAPAPPSAPKPPAAAAPAPAPAPSAPRPPAAPTPPAPPAPPAPTATAPAAPVTVNPYEDDDEPPF